jgi:hypothetical protein
MDLPVRSSGVDQLRDRRDKSHVDIGELPFDVHARMDDQAWHLHCGDGACDELLAICSWLDVQYHMILNSNDDLAARRAMAKLPAPAYRAYRLNVVLSRGWAMGEDHTWRLPPNQGSRALAQKRAQLHIWPSRLASLLPGHEVAPPARIECPSCRKVNAVQRQQRTGLPGLGGEERSGGTVGSRLQSRG